MAIFGDCADFYDFLATDRQTQPTCHPKASGSFSRSAVCNTSGGVSQISGIVSGVSDSNANFF